MSSQTAATPVLEHRSIDFVPEHERHGRASDQGRFWFMSNFQFFAIAIGLVGPSLGLSVGWTVIAAVLGLLVGTGIQAFHASQGAELGLPQMIQSRAQFGFRGVCVPLLGTLISLLGYNIVATILIADGMHGLWGAARVPVIAAVSVLAALLAVWGYRWIHRVFHALFWITLPLFAILSLSILLDSTPVARADAGGFLWPAFFTQLASAASFNVTAAPYVSDYSRYLPSSTKRWQIIAYVFAGSTLSALWLIALGAWLAAHTGESDGLVALRAAGNARLPWLGSISALAAIVALVATIGTNAYSAALTWITTVDCFRLVRTGLALRVQVILVLTLVWAAAAATLDGAAVGYVNAMLVIMLYFLTPWSAVNLIDYFFISQGRYHVPDLLRAGGRYVDWNRQGLAAYAVGFAASIPFFVVPDVYTGPIARALGGIDIGWLVGLCAASGCYWLLLGWPQQICRPVPPDRTG